MLEVLLIDDESHIVILSDDCRLQAKHKESRNLEKAYELDLLTSPLASLEMTRGEYA